MKRNENVTSIAKRLEKTGDISLKEMPTTCIPASVKDT